MCARAHVLMYCCNGVNGVFVSEVGKQATPAIGTSQTTKHLDTYGLDTYGLVTYGLDSYGLNTCVVDTYGLDTYGKDTYGLDTYSTPSLSAVAANSARATSLRLNIHALTDPDLICHMQRLGTWATGAACYMA